MFKYVFKPLFLMTFIITCFSSNLFAVQQNSLIQNAERQALNSGDAFIREFVARMKNDKICYDGKTLTLYTAPNSYEVGANILGLALFTGLAFHLTSQPGCSDADRLFLNLIFFGLDLMCLFFLGKNLYYENSMVPCITINDSEIKFGDGKCIKWNDVANFSSSIYQGNSSLIKFYDKFLNVLFEMEARNLPISADNLFSILSHYHNKMSYTFKDTFKKFILKTVKEAASNEKVQSV